MMLAEIMAHLMLQSLKNRFMKHLFIPKGEVILQIAITLIFLFYFRINADDQTVLLPFTSRMRVFYLKDVKTLVIYMVDR